MKVWIDIKNSHEPLFFKSMISNIVGPEYIITCRDFAEIVDLLQRNNFDYKVIGNRPEGDSIKRKFGFLLRVIQLLIFTPKFDISMNHWSGWSILVSRLRSRKTIVFNDNDINPDNSFFMKHINYLISPKFISRNYYLGNGLNPTSLFSFDGFKEDLYLADFVPKKDFYDEVPFRDFVTIRPENIQARYYSNNIRSIVPELLKILQEAKVNVLYLPRYEEDYNYAYDFDNIFIPDTALNGLDVCYNSKAVITGAGTFAREAACMGKTAVSFFGGDEFLAVDREMIRRNF